MYYYIDEKHPKKELRPDSLGVYKVDSIRDYAIANEQLQQLKDLYDQMGEEKEEFDDDAMAISEAIAEQERQLEEYVKSVGNFDTGLFGKNLDVLLKRSNLKMSELESILHLSTGYISRTIGVESKRKLSVEVLWKIAGLFQINIDDLVKRDITAPTKDLKAVAEFLDKLVKDTDEDKIRWQSVEITPNEENFYMFPFVNEKRVFVANSLPVGNCGLTDAYSVSVDIGEFNFFRWKNPSGKIEYGLYIFDNQLYENSRGEADAFIRIMTSASDLAGILDAECGRLMNSIKTREKDFVVSNEARKYMDRYLNPSKYTFDGEELPFT